MDDEAFGIPDVRQVGKQLEGIDKFLACFKSALNSETKDAPKAAFEVLGCQGVIRVIRQAWIRHPGHRLVTRKKLRNLQRVPRMLLLAQRKGFQPLQDQE